ncbi:hypothetical protein KGA66_04365 [Actinocrinis puniceicyclus]|uniref:Lipoprotein n=1 Tax=Actinocrinis puniceicyclus TaxID=977794 RepID=A0A8J7WM87_9ACTN|nr:hypothetical protein [Actinocrinis puniceicyclus]MBS2962267.1 hypothetical protein [Actinocrinis puniceicyclus]
MKFHPKRAAAVFAAVIMGVSALVTGGTAQASSASNYASSHASYWNHHSFDVAFQVRQMFSSSVNATNEADANSRNCTGCHSVAIAFQIVADGKVPTHVSAHNFGSAVNVNCSDCQTLGIAYQFIVAKPTVLSWSDQAKLWRIDAQLWSLYWSNAPASQIAGQVSALAGQVAYILAHAGHGYWPLVHHYITWRH